MREIIKTSMLINLSTYTIVYMVFSYTIWEFKNPFQWLIDIPTYEDLPRFAILCCVVVYYCVIIGISTEISKKEQ